MSVGVVSSAYPRVWILSEMGWEGVCAGLGSGYPGPPYLCIMSRVRLCSAIKKVGEMGSP